MSMTLMKDEVILELTNSSKYSINFDNITGRTFPDGIRVLCTVYAFTIANLSSNDSGNYTFSIVGQQFTTEFFILDAPRANPTNPTETIFRINSSGRWVDKKCILSSLMDSVNYPTNMYNYKIKNVHTTIICY